jgi:hypothetical protein
MCTVLLPPGDNPNEVNKYISYLAQFFLEWNMFPTKVVEKIKTQILCAVIFFKSCRLWENVEKYRRARKAKDDNMAHTHCILYNQGYKHTLRLCNTYCFSTATMVARTRLIVTYKYIVCLVKYLPVSCLRDQRLDRFHVFNGNTAMLYSWLGIHLGGSVTEVSSLLRCRQQKKGKIKHFGTQHMFRH